MAGASSPTALPSRLPPKPAPTPTPGPTHMGPPRKRVRLSEDDHATISERETEDLGTSLEVDFMILDYLSQHAINTCFSNFSSPQGDEDISDVERALLQVDEFRALFKRRYPSYRFDAEMRFRQQLLQLVTLFTQRLTRNCATPTRAALQTLRANNQHRARRWIGDASRLPTAGRDIAHFDSDLPISTDELDRNREHVMQALDLPAEDDPYDDAFYGTRDCVSLLDILPIFMKVSATCDAMFNGGINEQWMQLAAQWMLQACLEQYLVFGASGSDAVDEAFAWGYMKRIKSEAGQEEMDIPVENEETNGLFEDNEYAREVDGWSEIRDATLGELLPLASESQDDILTHLRALATRHHIVRTEHTILTYLQALAQVIPEPVLIQLEKGQLDEMSKEDTQEFMKSCGLGDSIAGMLV